MRVLPLVAALLLCGKSSAVLAAGDPPEDIVTARFEAIKSSPTRLRMFLQAMPKGGDLHNHLAGAPYAEDYLQWAAMAGFCVSEDEARLVPPPCNGDYSVSKLEQRNPFAFERLIDNLSTRGLQKGAGSNDVSGHTQFFSSFGKFGALTDIAVGKSLIATRLIADGDQVNYLELIHDPNALVQYSLGVPDVPLDAGSLSSYFERERGHVAAVVDKAAAELDHDEAIANAGLHCGRPSADPACRITIRYLAWGLRTLAPSRVFTSLMLSFAIADRDRRFVGVNFVGPEDSPVARRDYDLHMAMFRFLEAKYPKVRRTLHAGELAFGAVPPKDLRDHIRKALDAGAERIGHGTDIAYEQDAPAILARMAKSRIPVEINLTSNDVILGVKGSEHPLTLYRQMNVPVVLSTDDEGILRTDMTNEYVRAAGEHGFHYLDLKEAARASLEYSFLPGLSLWKNGRLGSSVDPCRQSLRAAACSAYLATSEKARLQADFEYRLQDFEQWVAEASF